MQVVYELLIAAFSDSTRSGGADTAYVDQRDQIRLSFIRMNYNGETVMTDIREIDGVNESIVRDVNASGLAYLTHTALRGRTVMRRSIVAGARARAPRAAY